MKKTIRAIAAVLAADAQSAFAHGAAAGQTAPHVHAFGGDISLAALAALTIVAVFAVRALARRPRRDAE